MNPFTRAKGNPNQAYDELKRVSGDARRHQDREVWMNVAYYLGEQWVEWITGRDDIGSLRAVPEATLPKNERLPMPVINKIMHFVNQQLAFALQTKPTPDVLPANDDPLALSDANVANAYLQMLMDPNVANFDRVTADATLWSLIANTAYKKWVFDPQLGRPTVQFCPSTDVYVDPYARDFYKARWIIHTQFMDPEAVYHVYGQEVAPTTVERADLERAAMLRELGQAPVMQGVVVNEMWMLPCRRYPEGVFRVWAGKEVLVESQKYPYRHMQLPFTQIGVIPRPNSQYYASPVTFLRAPQAELNDYHSQRLMTRKAWALLKLWLPEEIQLEEPWDDSPNQVLRGSSTNGAEPRVIGPPGAMPDNADGDWLKSEMGDIVGIHPVSEGQVPGRVEAAKAIEILRESDTSRLSTLLSTTATSTSRGCWQLLMLARQYVKELVVVQSYSKEGVPEVHRFMTGQFDPGMRVKVTQGSGLAYSRASRMDQLVTLWNNGVLRDPEAFAELADIPVPNIISTKAYDVRLARNENLTLADGVAITANSWDDHTIHIREHNNYRKTADFAAASAEVKGRFEHHVQEHKTLEMSQLEDDAKKAMLLQQAVGPPQPGAQPGDNSGGQAGTFYQEAGQGPGARFPTTTA